MVRKNRGSQTISPNEQNLNRHSRYFYIENIEPSKNIPSEPFSKSELQIHKYFLMFNVITRVVTGPEFPGLGLVTFKPGPFNGPETSTNFCEMNSIRTLFVLHL